MAQTTSATDEAQCGPATDVPCCGPPVPQPCESATCTPSTDAPWVEGVVDTSAGPVPRVSATLRFADTLGRWRARWAMRRMAYTVEPGLYAVGSPTPESPVLVSANYKMSFDHLRSQLAHHDAWILVLDTRGINVWCAAGKGTFGTDELVRRIETVRLDEIVSHRRLVVPQLGAPGVSAHEVRRQSGFRVVYGPVRAEDLPQFLQAGMKATPEMRRVRFALRDRVVLIPVEFILSLKYLAIAAVVLLLLSGLWRGGYSPSRIATVGGRHVLLLLAAYLAGAALVPMLLPWLPGRAFSAKGAWAGLALILGVAGVAYSRPDVLENWAAGAGWLLLAPAVASFIGMNFTGASTYTSLSGVREEMRIAVPAQIAATLVGLALWVAGRFV